MPLVQMRRSSVFCTSLTQDKNTFYSFVEKVLEDAMPYNPNMNDRDDRGKV